jgi:hypothetical protein
VVLPSDARKQATEALEPFCERRTPIWVRDQVVLQFRVQARDVVLYEKRPSFHDRSRWVECLVAKFRFTRKSGLSSLLWADRHSKWHHDKHCAPSADFRVLLEEVDADPKHVFWG